MFENKQPGYSDFNVETLLRTQVIRKWSAIRMLPPWRRLAPYIRTVGNHLRSFVCSSTSGCEAQTSTSPGDLPHLPHENIAIRHHLKRRDTLLYNQILLFLDLLELKKQFIVFMNYYFFLLFVNLSNMWYFVTVMQLG